MFSKSELRKRGLITTGYHLPYNPKLKERARELRKNMTESEKLLWDRFLKHFQYTVLRQKPIDHYIVDFYCAKAKLVIEVDGKTHFTEEGKTYDQYRDEILQGYGLTVLHVTNDDVLQNFWTVCKVISRYLNAKS